MDLSIENLRNATDYSMEIDRFAGEFDGDVQDFLQDNVLDEVMEESGMPRTPNQTPQREPVLNDYKPEIQQVIQPVYIQYLPAPTVQCEYVTFMNQMYLPRQIPQKNARRTILPSPIPQRPKISPLKRKIENSPEEKLKSMKKGPKVKIQRLSKEEIEKYSINCSNMPKFKEKSVLIIASMPKCSTKNNGKIINRRKISTDVVQNKGIIPNLSPEISKISKEVIMLDPKPENKAIIPKNSPEKAKITEKVLILNPGPENATSKISRRTKIFKPEGIPSQQPKKLPSQKPKDSNNNWIEPETDDSEDESDDELSEVLSEGINLFKNNSENRCKNLVVKLEKIKTSPKMNPILNGIVLMGSDQIIRVETPKIRGPGRVKKQIVPVSFQPEITKSQPPKLEAIKKSPKMNKMYEKRTQSDPPVLEKLDKSRNEKNDQDVNLVDPVKNAQIETPKRGRGRPKKQTILTNFKTKPIIKSRRSNRLSHHGKRV